MCWHLLLVEERQETASKTRGLEYGMTLTHYHNITAVIIVIIIIEQLLMNELLI